MPIFHSSILPVLQDLRRNYPDSPFLALGQTVWWDEPMKAVLRRMLDETGLGGRMILGVHDTDYFAKARVRAAGTSRFVLLPHNDGETKDLWSAAGEISRLFGSETFPTKHDFKQHGVPFDRLVRAQGFDRNEFTDRVTEAWGWRGLVYTGSRDRIVHLLPLGEVGEAIEEMLRWGFDGTIEQIADECCRKEAMQLAESLLEQCRQYRRENPDATLTDLYQHMLPRLFSLLLGYTPENTGICRSSHLLRFNSETASLPRFEVLDHFLDWETAELARQAYDEAVRGSEIYTLDRFGIGALPFDLVLPEHGRGTLRVTLRALHVETRKPIRIPLYRPVKSAQDLAGVLTRELGNEVVLVGKAVTLISMLAREFIFVFSEEGSGYVRLTRKMNDRFRAGGVDLDLRPILRLSYGTWSALEVGVSNLSLPHHLESAFDEREIPAAKFAARWVSIVRAQGDLLDQVKRIRSPRELLRFLVGKADGPWEALSAEYAALRESLKQAAGRAAEVQGSVSHLYARLAEVKRKIVETERAKGSHYRATTEWSESEVRNRASYDLELSTLLAERRRLLLLISEHKATRLSIEREGEAARARARASEIEIQAEMARLTLVRNAILTVQGLTHTHHRPSAWWIPMVDRSGHWFRRIVETTEVYSEPLLTL